MKKILLILAAVLLSSHIAFAASYDFGAVTLRMGIKNSYVASLQNALNSFTGAGLVADGSFGLKTKYAVIAFQTSQGLKSDGIFGSASRVKLLAISNGNTPVPQTACTNRQITSFPDGVNRTSMGIPDFEITSPVEGVYHAGDSIKIKWVPCHTSSSIQNIIFTLESSIGSSSSDKNITIGSASYTSGEYDYTIPVGIADVSRNFHVSGFDGMISDSSANGDVSGSFFILP